MLKWNKPNTAIDNTEGRKLIIINKPPARKKPHDGKESTEIQGSKHTFSRIAPVLLLNKNLEIFNTPRTIDTSVINQVLALSYNKNRERFAVPEDLSGKSRSIINLIPGLLYKHKSVSFFHPKGCTIGERRIDLYLQIAERFGVGVEINRSGNVILRRNHFQPIRYTLPFPSFTGTSIALLFASITQGTSELENISIEPEILELIDLLKKSGIRIVFTGERTLMVEGIEDFPNKHIKFRVNEDRNVLVTRLMMALISEMPFSYSSDNKLFLGPLIDVLDRMGIKFDYTPYSVRVAPCKSTDIRPVEIICDHFPEFCSDWQPLIAPLLCKAGGISVIRDKIFEDRYNYIRELNKINENFSFKIYPNRLEIRGTNQRSPVTQKNSTVTCLDLRSGAANVIAALGEYRKVTILNIHQIERGYENILEDLRSAAPPSVVAKIL